MIYPNAKYEIYVCDSLGNIIAPFNTIDFNLFVEINITRSVNNVGGCYIRLSGGSNSVSILSYMTRYNILKKDTIFAIYRTIGNVRSLLLDTVWFVRTIEQFRQSTGSFVIKITAVDTNYLLKSRIITKIETGITGKTTIANIISAFVKLNIGSGSGSRQMTGFTESQGLGVYGYPLEYYLNDASTVNAYMETFNYFNLYSAIAKLSDLTLNPINVNDALYPVYFDTIAVSTNTFIFQLFANQRGADRRYLKNSAKGIILSDTLEQMRDIRLTADWNDECTSIYSSYKLSSGEEKKYSTTDYRRIANSPFSLREKYVASPVSTEIGLQTFANAELRSDENYPTYSVYATIQDIPSFLFGVDWNYGDYVTINAFGTHVDARINSINITLSNKSEQIDVKFQIAESISF